MIAAGHGDVLNVAVVGYESGRSTAWWLASLPGCVVWVFDAQSAQLEGAAATLARHAPKRVRFVAGGADLDQVVAHFLEESVDLKVGGAWRSIERFSHTHGSLP